MYAEITKQFKFEAAHRLDYHQGQCRNLHGHSYKAEVTVSGEVQSVDSFNSESGMVIDFKTVSDVWKEHLESILDHGDNYLNDILDWEGRPMYPTAENLARYILNVFRHWIQTVSVDQVKLWETETSYAVVR